MKKLIITGAALLTLGTTWGIAQDSKEGHSGIHGTTEQRIKEPKSGGASAHISMGQLMKDCMQHQQAAMQSIDQMNTTMERAKQSNDPAEMRAALEQSQKHLMEMKEHMTMCGNMMSMMEKMPGTGGMMKGGAK